MGYEVMNEDSVRYAVREVRSKFAGSVNYPKLRNGHCHSQFEIDVQSAVSSDDTHTEIYEVGEIRARRPMRSTDGCRTWRQAGEN